MAKAKTIYRSIFDIEKEYYPDTFEERKRKLSLEEGEKYVGVSLANRAIQQIKKDLEGIANIC